MPFQMAPPRSVSVAHQFYWPNGDIPFELVGLDLSTDHVTLHIQPEIR